MEITTISAMIVMIIIITPTVAIWLIVPIDATVIRHAVQYFTRVLHPLQRGPNVFAPSWANLHCGGVGAE